VSVVERVANPGVGSSAPIIRLLVADDHHATRQGLVRLLDTVPDIDVVAVADDGDQAVRLAIRYRPDVILMDLRMPYVDGSEATRRVLGHHPEIQVVILTSFSEREEIIRAIDAGAVGYLLKDVDPQELIRGVRAAANGDSPLAPSVARTLLEYRAAQSSHELTDRETQVLKCVARGLPNKLIARELEISSNTVKAHLTTIFHRIGVNDRVHAALWARDRGIARTELSRRA
jgi:DNA-binding NarL/FixJ family response regulator